MTELFILFFADDIFLLSDTTVGLQNQLYFLARKCVRLDLHVNLKNIVIFRMVVPQPLQPSLPVHLPPSTTATILFPSPTEMLPQRVLSPVVTHPPPRSPTTATTPRQLAAMPPQWGTPTVADHNDNTASVGSNVAPAAALITAGTPTVSDVSDNTTSLGSDGASTAGSRGSSA